MPVNQQITVKNVKKGIKKFLLPDTFYLQAYSAAPYMACGHGCTYCDGRAERYYVAGDFEQDLIVRQNLPQVFAQELAKLREQGTIFFGSGITDCYQPLEAEYKIMAKLAESMQNSRFSATVLTKSALIRRDLPLWSALNQSSGFSFMTSLVFSDDNLRKIFEPKASSVNARLSTLAACKAAGISSGVSAMPFIPFIGDSKKQIENLIGKLAELQIDWFIPGFLTLRPGRQKDFFLNCIKQHFPAYLEDFQQLYSENRSSGIGKTSYYRPLSKMISSLLADYKIPQLIPHKVYRGRFPIYSEIYILLEHMLQLYPKSVAKNRLAQSSKLYREWLSSEKKSFNRRRSISQFQQEEQFRLLIRNGKLARIIDNQKLADFIGKVALEGAIFDYLELDLD
ncbi:MAG: hypothetical protein R6U84_01190 [Candidatus Cloacimonadales bacterium]